MLGLPDAAAAFHETTLRGAAPAMAVSETRDERGVLRTAAIQAYGDTLIRFVERDDYAGTFAPGFREVPATGASAGWWPPRRARSPSDVCRPG